MNQFYSGLFIGKAYLLHIFVWEKRSLDERSVIYKVKHYCGRLIE